MGGQTVEVGLDVGIPSMCSIGGGGLHPDRLGEGAHALFDPNALFLKIAVTRCREFETSWSDEEDWVPGDDEGEQMRLSVEPTETDTRMTELDRCLLSELPWS
jgi:hypothetical protein